MGWKVDTQNNPGILKDYRRKEKNDMTACLLYRLQYSESNKHHLLDMKEVAQMVCLSGLTRKVETEEQKEPTSHRK